MTGKHPLYGRRTHNLSSHPLYSVWAGIMGRCHNKRFPQYKDYGGRGIIMNSSWRSHPERFIEWALTNGWEPGLCIDRIDNDDYYKPSNCRFVTRAYSNRHQRVLNSKNTSGYRGVGKYGNRYTARIRINGTMKHLGSFSSPRLAALRYDVEAIILDDGRPTNFGVI